MFPHSKISTIHWEVDLNKALASVAGDHAMIDHVIVGQEDIINITGAIYICRRPVIKRSSSSLSGWVYPECPSSIISSR